MPLLIWTPRALQDVARLHRFLAEKNRSAANQAVGAIRRGVLILGTQSGLGRPVAEMDAEFREWLITFGDSGYVVLYRIDSDRVVLLAVRHQRELDY
jgi:plasmid stabilization system protein ParE